MGPSPRAKTLDPVPRSPYTQVIVAFTHSMEPMTAMKASMVGSGGPAKRPKDTQIH